MRSTTAILIALVIILTGAVGYLVGRTRVAPSPSPSASAVATSTPTPSLLPSASPVAPSPSPTTQKVTGGGILKFPRYEMTIPSTWTHSRESSGEDDEKVIVQGGAYRISILQGGFGGNVCLYPGDADFEGPAGRYSTYVELTTKSGDKLRRSTPESDTGFAICYLSQYGWTVPTVYGYIGLTSPSNPTPSDLAVVDSILTSLTKL